MNINSRKILRHLLPTIILVAIVFLPYGNRASAAFECSGNIFDTLTKIRDSGKGGVSPEVAPFTLFQISGCVLAQLTTYLLSLANVIAVLMIMVSGIKYTFSSGNPSAQQAAMKSLNAAVVGFAILICFWSIFRLLLTLLRV